MSFTKFEELLEIKTNQFTEQLKYLDLKNITRNLADRVTEDMQSHQIFSFANEFLKTVWWQSLQFHACLKNLYFKYFGKIYSKISGLSLC